MTTTEQHAGLGRTIRQRMKRQWKQEGAGKSLKQWARDNALVGTEAQAWIEGKKGP